MCFEEGVLCLLFGEKGCIIPCASQLCITRHFSMLKGLAYGLDHMTWIDGLLLLTWGHSRRFPCRLAAVVVR